MAAVKKKIIGRDAMGNPIYESSTSSSSSGIGSGIGVGGASVDNTSRQTSPGRPGVGGTGSFSGGRDIKYKNLQGAPQNTALSLLGEGPAEQMPTKAELDAIRNNTSAKSGGAGGGKGGSPYANMLKALQQLSAMSQEGINDSMDSLTRTLQAQTNPFANFQAQQTQTTPGLEQLLKSQGVATDPLQQYATAINAQNTGQAKAFQNLADTLAGFNTANQQGMVADAGQQRSDLLNQLQGSVFGTGASLMGKQAPNRNAIVQMLLQAMGNRA